MKKLFCVFLAMALLCACGCQKGAGVISLDEDYVNLSESLLGMTEAKVHEAYGQPSSFLSGFRGDVYRVPGDRLLILYYDKDLKVEHVKLSVPVDAGNVIRVAYTEDLRKCRTYDALYGGE